MIGWFGPRNRKSVCLPFRHHDEERNELPSSRPLFLHIRRTGAAPETTTDRAAQNQPSFVRHATHCTINTHLPLTVSTIMLSQRVSAAALRRGTSFRMIPWTFSGTRHVRNVLLISITLSISSQPTFVRFLYAEPGQGHTGIKYLPHTLSVRLSSQATVTPFSLLSLIPPRLQASLIVPLTPHNC